MSEAKIIIIGDFGSAAIRELARLVHSSSPPEMVIFHSTGTQIPLSFPVPILSRMERDSALSDYHKRKFWHEQKNNVSRRRK